jgi:two-component system, NtrC family, nitrogen regulation sensor histidine kinase GlnL
VSRATKAPPLPAPLARGALDSIGDPIVLVGPDGGVVHLNPAAEELFDRSRERAVGLPVRALPGGAPLEALADRVRRSQEATGADVPAPRNPSIPLGVEGTPLFEGASCVGTVLVVRAKRNGERHLDFEALAAGLAHEIKNPLAGLQGSAELLAREAEGAAREYALVIAREARRVDGLVRELLDLARPATLQAGPVNVHTVLRDVLVIAKGMPGGDRVLFTQHFDPSLPPLQGDQEKLTQVLLNLLRNAVEAARETPGAEVTMETGVAPVRLRQAGGRTVPLARVAVLDNGPGIPETMLPRLFTPFATSKAQGTGLGLAVSRRIVEGHGGRIEVRNRPGGGAEAAVYLPLAPT